MNHIKNIWKCFEEKHATFAKWLYQIFYFVIFSMGVTVFQYLVFTFLPGILGIGLAGTEFMWPKVSMNLFGVKFTWSLLGYNVLRDATGNILIGGGLGYFISYELGSFLAQCINFPLQRNITFKSHGNSTCNNCHKHVIDCRCHICRCNWHPQIIKSITDQ